MGLAFPIDRATAAATVMGRVLSFLTMDAETVIRRSDGATVNVLADPSTYVWQETEGGGREVIRAVLFVTTQGALDVGDLVDMDTRRWVVVEAERERLFGRVVGDAYTVERVFGTL